MIHCIRQASGEAVDPWVCDVDSMQSGVELARWFKNETQRIYGLLRESQDERDLRQIAHWIHLQGGTVRARDLISGRRDINNVEEAESLLRRLCETGYGHLQRKPPGKNGGRPSIEFTLYPESDVNANDDDSSAEPD